MSDSPVLTIVFALRDRDAQRIDRCLWSLQQQTLQNFEVIITDYGSRPQSSDAAQDVVAQYDFCKYIYSEASGLQWNKPRALNSGIRRARGQFTISSDIDMAFSPSFTETIISLADENRVLVQSGYYLPQGFEDWDNLNQYTKSLERAPSGSVGMMTCAPTSAWHTMYGSDEFYTYWGVEDNDTLHRLQHLLQLEVMQIHNETAIFHQWHPTSDYITEEYAPYLDWTPDDVRYRMVWHYERFRKCLIRNGDDWGKIYTFEDRPILAFLDFQNKTILEDDRTHVFDYYNRTNPYFSRAFSHQFWQLPPGHVLIVPRLHYPRRGRKAAPLLRWLNRLTARYSLEFDFSTNRAYNFLGGLIIDEHGRAIKDYYLDFPAMGGCALFMRGEDQGEKPIPGN